MAALARMPTGYTAALLRAILIRNVSIPYASRFRTGWPLFLRWRSLLVRLLALLHFLLLLLVALLHGLSLLLVALLELLISRVVGLLLGGPLVFLILTLLEALPFLILLLIHLVLSLLVLLIGLRSRGAGRPVAPVRFGKVVGMHVSWTARARRRSA